MFSYLLRAVTLFLAVAVLLLPMPAPAQQPGRFTEVTATARFPEEILFTASVEGDSDIVALELTYRVSGNPYSSSRYPSFIPDRRVETTYRLDTQVEFYPPGSEFHYYWTATDAQGNVFESGERAFTYEDDRFTWQQAGTDRVAVHWYKGGQDFGQNILDTATRALLRLEEDAGVQAERRIHLYIYATSRDLRGALGPNAAAWIGGQAIPHLGLIVAHISPEEEESSEIGRMIPHELSHVVLYEATHNPYADNPNWLEEGIAVHNQEVADAEYPFLVRNAAEEGRLIPLRALSAEFPSDTELALLSYAESANIIEFILETYGREGLAALVDVFAEGETAEAGVQRALGITLDELEARWRATLPATERTPFPQDTAEQPVSDDFLPTPLLAVITSATACTCLVGVGVVIAALVLVLRRNRAYKEVEHTEGQPPVPPGWD